jgi:4-aminobutyrate aminotransferase-like enzyme
LFGIAGAFTPPREVLHKVVGLIRENGGLWIADEILTGLGRLGSHFWGFDVLNCGSNLEAVYPDILTVGKPLGNGFPISLVVTSSQIAKPAAESLAAVSFDLLLVSLNPVRFYFGLWI